MEHQQYRHFTLEDLVTSSNPDMQAIGRAIQHKADRHPFNQDATITHDEAAGAESAAWRPPVTAYEAAANGGPSRFGLQVKRVES